MTKIGSLACIAGAALLAGCASASPPAAKLPTLPRSLAADWAASADAIAAAAAGPGGDPCHAYQLAVSLQQEVTASQSRISPRLYQPLAAGLSALLADLPCPHPPKGPKPPKDHGHGPGGDGG